MPVVLFFVLGLFWFPYSHFTFSGFVGLESVMFSQNQVIPKP